MSFIPNEQHRSTIGPKFRPDYDLFLGLCFPLILSRSIFTQGPQGAQGGLSPAWLLLLLCTMAAPASERRRDVEALLSWMGAQW